MYTVDYLHLKTEALKPKKKTIENNWKKKSLYMYVTFP